MLLNPQTAPTLSYEILVAISSKISEKSKILVDVILLFTLVFVVYVCVLPCKLKLFLMIVAMKVRIKKHGNCS